MHVTLRVTEQIPHSNDVVVSEAVFDVDELPSRGGADVVVATLRNEVARKLIEEIARRTPPPGAKPVPLDPLRRDR